MILIFGLALDLVLSLALGLISSSLMSSLIGSYFTGSSLLLIISSICSLGSSSIIFEYFYIYILFDRTNSKNNLNNKPMVTNTKLKLIAAP